jgi:hypothetical protein
MQSLMRRGRWAEAECDPKSGVPLLRVSIDLLHELVTNEFHGCTREDLAFACLLVLLLIAGVFLIPFAKGLGLVVNANRRSVRQLQLCDTSNTM